MLAQSSACNRLHAVHERCARWLLMTRDRVDGDSFPLTHEFLSLMPGVRRATVSVVVEAMQREGLLTSKRGIVTVLDPARLIEETCECYRIIQSEFARLLEAKPAAPILDRIRRGISTGTTPRRSRAKPL